MRKGRQNLKNTVATWIKTHKPHAIGLAVVILLVLIAIILALVFSVGSRGGDTVSQGQTSQLEQVQPAPDSQVSQTVSQVSQTVSQEETVSAPAQETPSQPSGQETSSETAASETEASSQPAQSQPTQSTDPGGSSGSESTVPSGSTGSPSTHQHNWQPHQVWVPNIVTVVDVPEQTVQGAQLYTQQPDGTWLSNGETYWFENGFTMEDFREILMDKIRNEGYPGNYVNRTKTIPAVTHQEDQGSYQIDYYYCDCGATRQP